MEERGIKGVSQMAIKKRWSKFTEANVKKVPEELGVYQIAYPTARGKEIWHPGKATNLRKRLLQHLRDPKLPKHPYFRYYEMGWGEDLDELERELFEDFEKRHPVRPKGAPRKPRRYWPFSF